ncbi:MAG: hypothetical protein QM652_12430 [Legionella sp.]|uniref:hypothetical protein n=1 Tax=Legionella sp. TaxID=459 RepID=UPI0039E42B30
MKDSEQIEQFYLKLENKRVEQVKIELAQGVYNQNKNLVETWLNTKKEASDNQLKERSIAISEEANQIAKSSNKISWISLVFSGAALLISILVAIFKK